jgi:hypothetical protein
MIDVLIVETTTLPEGPVVTLERLRRDIGTSATTYTQLRAYKGRDTVTMRVDEIGLASFRQYLDLVCKEIARQRARFIKKPEMCYRRPETITEFVHNMIFSGMFLLDTWHDTNGTKTISNKGQTKSAIRGKVAGDSRIGASDSDAV